MMIPVPRLILASVSPRRAVLIREAGYDVEIIPPPLEEPTGPEDHPSPGQLAEALSHFKAKSVAGLVDDGLIIAGDTVVALEGRVYGKPADRADARAILTALTGSTHDVLTGVTLLDARTGKCLIRHDRTAVTMRRMTDVEMEAYLDSGAWEGKAGAYGIQDYADAFVERIEGSFTNVVGLPMELLARMLREWGAPVPQPPPGPVPPV
jgi:septum formation protein